MNLTISFFINGHLRETKQITTPCTIGRDGQSDWVLWHPMLSRNHCVLFDKEDELYLVDKGSLNGTHFQGVPAEKPVRLQLGDDFTVGGSNLTFHISAPVEKDIQTDGVEFAEKTTTVFTKDESATQQSTVLLKDPSVEGEMEE